MMGLPPRRHRTARAAMQTGGRAVHRPHPWVRGLALLATLCSTVAVTPIPAHAIVGELPDSTWQTDGPVYAVARAGSQIGRAHV